MSWQTTDRIGFIGSTVIKSALWDWQADADLRQVGGSMSNLFNDGVFRQSAGTGNSAIGGNTTPATIHGTVRRDGGSFANTWPVAAGQTLLGVDGANKNFLGALFTNLGTVAWQSTERIGFISAGVLDAGTWDMQADAGLTCAAGSTTVGGSHLFVNGGVIEAASGTIDFGGGGVTFNGGTQFVGAGVSRVSNGAGFVGAFSSQNLELAAGTFSGDNTTPAVIGGHPIAARAPGKTCECRARRPSP